ncbi:MAG: glycosyltransferase family 4 protein [Hyphomicrobiales bacterium]|nr:glycosyltransferase family 4 protein [Hyphomicrobiales bacterium]
MRILMTLTSLQVGGAERNVVALLPHLRNEGLDVSLCTLGTQQDSFLAGKVAQHSITRFDLGARRLIDPSAFKRFLRLIKEQNVELLHAEDQYATLFCAAAAPLTGVKWIYTRHNEIEEQPNRRAKIKAELTFRAARGATRCIAVSEAIRQGFHRRTQIPTERIVTIHNGIDITPFTAGTSTKIEKRRELGWKPDDVVLIYVAVIRKDKGHDVLFKAAPRIRECVPNAIIKIVGDGPHAAIRKQEASHLSDYVEFMGQRDDVPALLMAADLLVMPSRTEGLPTAPIEAAAAGLPVVASDVGGTKEIVADGETGFLVPAGDADALAERVIHLLQQPDGGRQMGLKARERVQRLFTLENQAALTAQLYRSVGGTDR